MPNPEEYAAVLASLEEKALSKRRLTPTYTYFGRHYRLFGELSRLFPKGAKVDALIVGCGEPDHAVSRTSHLPPEPFEVASQLERAGTDYRVSVIDYAYKHPKKPGPVLAQDPARFAHWAHGTYEMDFVEYLRGFLPSAKRERHDRNPELFAITPPAGVAEKISFHQGNALRELPAGRNRPNLVISLTTLCHYSPGAGRDAFLRTLASAVAPKGYLLLGEDLHPRELEALGLEHEFEIPRRAGGVVYRKR